MSIWITGDIHGEPNWRLSTKFFPQQCEFGDDKSENVVIILGDFGVIWGSEETVKETYWLNWLEKKPFTVVFIDGNHDNIPRLDSFPEVEWCGGVVNKIRSNIFRLKRGEVYTIQGKKFFAFGGARSHDIQDGILDPADYSSREEFERVHREWTFSCKYFRVKNETWWEEELPTEAEMQHGLDNLEKHDWCVDYILSHTPSTSIVKALRGNRGEPDVLTDYLDKIRSLTEFKVHFAGHMHVTQVIGDKDILLYGDFVSLGGDIDEVLYG